MACRQLSLSISHLISEGSTLRFSHPLLVPLSLYISLPLSHTHARTYGQTDTHIHLCTHTHAHAHKHTHTKIHTHARTHTHTHLYTHTPMHTHTHLYTHTPMHTHAHTHTHTHTHTYTHTGCRVVLAQRSTQFLEKCHGGQKHSTNAPSVVARTPALHMAQVHATISTASSIAHTIHTWIYIHSMYSMYISILSRL